MVIRPEDLPETPAEPEEQLPHEFETDVLCLVSANHNLTVQAIAVQEKKLREQREEERGKYSEEEFQQLLGSDENFYQDLRVAARSQALVSLITRMQHWANKYSRRVEPSRHTESLKAELEFLNTTLADEGHVEVEYFVELVNVRDSIVHGDSKPKWKQPQKQKGGRTGYRPRGVIPRYAPNSWRVEISETDLQNAVANATKQILWYDEQLRAIGK